MAVPPSLRFLAKLGIAAVLVVPPTAIWLSGRFGDEDERPIQQPARAPLATLPRSETSAVPAPRPLPSPDAPPAPAQSVTVGPGAVTVPPAVPGAAPVPDPRSGRVVGEPQGIPDPNRSEAMPR